jgi:hypothetical protein
LFVRFQDLVGRYVIAGQNQIRSRPHRRNLRHLLKFMTQTAGGVRLELAHDVMGGEDGWRGHGHIHAIREDAEVVELECESLSALTNELL